MKLASSILESGKAYEKFLQIIKAQQGCINHIPEARFRQDIFAEKNTQITEIEVKKINALARVLGCPASKSAGIYLWKHKKEQIQKKEKILTLYSESKIELKEAMKFYNKNKPLIFR
jgi:thymidine phosphorylase